MVGVELLWNWMSKYLYHSQKRCYIVVPNHILTTLFRDYCMDLYLWAKGGGISHGGILIKPCTDEDKYAMRLAARRQ